MLLARLAPNGFRPTSQGLAISLLAFAALATPPDAILARRIERPLVPGSGMFVLGALIVDGLAISLRTGLYGQSGDSITGLAALLLWGVGVTLAVVRLSDRRARGIRAE